MVLAVLAIVIYLYRERMSSGPRRLIATALCGLVVFLGGLSWEAFGIFVLIILSAELWKFCTTDTENNLKEYILWMLMFVPWLYLISPAYRSGYGFSTHVAALMLAPGLALLALKSIRYLLLRFVKQLCPHARKLAWGLTLFGIAAGGIYVISQYNTFATTAFPFMENRLMKTVSELKNPDLIDWVDRYGSMFILGSIWTHRYRSIPLEMERASSRNWTCPILHNDFSPRPSKQLDWLTRKLSPFYCCVCTHCHRVRNRINTKTATTTI